MPLAGALGHQFCWIFAEAYLLAGKEKGLWSPLTSLKNMAFCDFSNFCYTPSLITNLVDALQTCFRLRLPSVFAFKC